MDITPFFCHTIMNKNTTIEFSNFDLHCMNTALQEAKNAALNGEVPVGAVLTYKDTIISQAANSPISSIDPTAHAEILAIRQAAKIIDNYRLPDTTLYVTLEPCIMCMGAIIHSRITRLVFATHDPKTGAAESCYSIGKDNILNHTLQINSGLLQDECSFVLKEFFKKKRAAKKELILTNK